MPRNDERLSHFVSSILNRSTNPRLIKALNTFSVCTGDNQIIDLRRNENKLFGVWIKIVKHARIGRGLSKLQSLQTFNKELYKFLLLKAWGAWRSPQRARSSLATLCCLPSRLIGTLGGNLSHTSSFSCALTNARETPAW